MRSAIVIATIMICAAVAGIMLRPSQTASAAVAQVSFAERIPTTFARWRKVQPELAQIVNPQTQELLDKLYNQFVTRVCKHGSGRVIMVTVAYGDDQRGGLRTHMPAVCHKAQGFTLHDEAGHEIDTACVALPAKRLSTSLRTHKEPVTYSFKFGDRTVDAGSTLARRLIEVPMGFDGKMPQGLFCVSSIDGDSDRAYGMHDRFVSDLLASIPDGLRTDLTGLVGEGVPQ